MKKSIPFVLKFTKDDARDITYVHDDDGQNFIIHGYPDQDNTITVEGAESMNLLMNILAAAGYEGDAVI